MPGVGTQPRDSHPSADIGVILVLLEEARLDSSSRKLYLGGEKLNQLAVRKGIHSPVKRVAIKGCMQQEVPLARQ